MKSLQESLGRGGDPGPNSQYAGLIIQAASSLASATSFRDRARAAVQTAEMEATVSALNEDLLRDRALICDLRKQVTDADERIRQLESEVGALKAELVDAVRQRERQRQILERIGSSLSEAYHAVAEEMDQCRCESSGPYGSAHGLTPLCSHLASLGIVFASLCWDMQLSAT